jgi:hypothetical protein
MRSTGFRRTFVALSVCSLAASAAWEEVRADAKKIAALGNGTVGSPPHPPNCLPTPDPC